MGLTHKGERSSTLAQKRQYTNENITNSTTLIPYCSSCGKGFGGDDCCVMRAQFQKRSREVSPQRKPLGTMDMLLECQNISKKTEVLGIVEHKIHDTLNFSSLSDAVEEAQVQNLSSESNPKSVSATAFIPSTEASLHSVHGVSTGFAAAIQSAPHLAYQNKNWAISKHKTSLPVRVLLPRGRSVPKSQSCHFLRKRQQPLVNLVKAEDGYEDESDCSEDGNTDSAETDEHKEVDFDSSQTESSNEEEEVDSSVSGNDVTESHSIATDRRQFNLFSGIRLSQFPFVPPFINFCQHEGKCSCLSQEIKKILKWRLSPITPTVVRDTVTSSGFRLLKKTVEWTGQWGKHMKAVMFRAALKDYQKLNHLPATFQIGRKDKLWRNYQRCSCKYGKEDFGFLPKSYILPQEMKSFKTAWDASPKGRPWIIKPPAGARGNGIRVINRWGQVPKRRSTVAQKYISKPFLINSRKFDIRLYVLVTSFHPLKIYIYRDGLVRFAPVKYSQDSKRVSDRFMHLTNYSVNKYCDLYTKNEDAESMEGHKWTLKSLWRFLNDEGHNVDKLWSSIEDIAIKTFICAEDQISASAFNLPSRYNGYELFGLDIILDERLKPWLLEVNISPSLHSSSPLDLAVKAPLIREVFNIVGYHFPDFMSNSLKKQLIGGMDANVKLETPVFDKRLYANTLSPEEKAKQHSVKSHSENREKYLKTVLRNLTPDDLRYLVQAEDELSQCNGFKRIFPSANSHEYFKFFEGPRYYNLLLNSWENKYANCRTIAITKLQQHCATKMHLQVAQTSGKGSISVVDNPHTTTDTKTLTTEAKLDFSPSSENDANGNEDIKTTVILEPAFPLHLCASLQCGECTRQ